MDTYKIRVKIGNAEFDAEGPEETVKEQFEAFKELLKSAPSAAKTDETETSTTRVISQTSPGVVESDRLKALYVFGKSGDSLSLAFAPQGEDRVQRATLLVLYGYRRLLNQEDVPVTALKESLEQSGFIVGRVDRSSVPLIREGLVWKGGKGKGGKYRLSNLGSSRADTEAKRLLEQA